MPNLAEFAEDLVLRMYCARSAVQEGQCLKGPEAGARQPQVTFLEGAQIEKLAHPNPEIPFFSWGIGKVQFEEGEKKRELVADGKGVKQGGAKIVENGKKNCISLSRIERETFQSPT